MHVQRSDSLKLTHESHGISRILRYLHVLRIKFLVYCSMPTIENEKRIWFGHITSLHTTYMYILNTRPKPKDYSRKTIEYNRDSNPRPSEQQTKTKTTTWWLRVTTFMYNSRFIELRIVVFFRKSFLLLFLKNWLCANLKFSDTDQGNKHSFQSFCSISISHLKCNLGRRLVLRNNLAFV